MLKTNSLFAALAALAIAACADLPTRPTPVAASPAPVKTFSSEAPGIAGVPPVRDLPVDLGPLGIPDVGFVCHTQPRQYTAPDGRVETVIDHYVQREPCPEVPIQ